MAELVDGTVMTAEHVSVDAEFRKGAALALKQALDAQVDAAVLQSRSPSCGVHQVYDGSFGNKLIQGQGVFAKLLRDAGIKLIDAQDLSSKEH